MDINTLKVIRNSLKLNQEASDRPEDTTIDQKENIKICLKLSDYMAF
jgi:hypothetical protein